MQNNPEQRDGSLYVDWHIATDGTAVDAGVINNDFANHVAGKPLASCVIAAIDAIIFPPPLTIQYVAHTVTFKHQHTLKREAEQTQKPMLELYR